MHLTNYAINSKSESYEHNTDPDDIHSGHKRSLQALYHHLAQIGHDVTLLKGKINDLIIKTLISVQPSLAHVYHSCQPDDIHNNMCFEILGFDILLDCKLKPHIGIQSIDILIRLVEVNHAPSFATESELDYRVKDKNGGITKGPHAKHVGKNNRKQYKRETMRIMRLYMIRQAAIDRCIRECAITSSSIGFTLLYPTKDKEIEYREYHDEAIDIWETLTGGRSRRPVRINTVLLSSQYHDEAVLLRLLHHIKQSKTKGVVEEENLQAGSVPNETPGSIKNKGTSPKGIRQHQNSSSREGVPTQQVLPARIAELRATTPVVPPAMLLMMMPTVGLVAGN
ncbi:Tubulin tyrosine ligase-like, member, partial [Perkinsus olseni]